MERTVIETPKRLAYAVKQLTRALEYRLSKDVASERARNIVQVLAHWQPEDGHPADIIEQMLQGHGTKSFREEIGRMADFACSWSCMQGIDIPSRSEFPRAK